jgi:hypothetical protein
VGDDVNGVEAAQPVKRMRDLPRRWRSAIKHDRLHSGSQPAGNRLYVVD